MYKTLKKEKYMKVLKKIVLTTLLLSSVSSFTMEKKVDIYKNKKNNQKIVFNKNKSKLYNRARLGLFNCCYSVFINIAALSGGAIMFSFSQYNNSKYLGPSIEDVNLNTTKTACESINNLGFTLYPGTWGFIKYKV